MRIGIVGYGNLGRSLELASEKSSDAELVGIFTARDPDAVKSLGSSLTADGSAPCRAL